MNDSTRLRPLRLRPDYDAVATSAQQEEGEINGRSGREKRKGRARKTKQNKKETKQKQQQKLAVVSVVPALEPERLRRPVI